MSRPSDINLLKAKTVLSPRVLAIEEQLRVASLVLLFLVLSATLFFGVGYAILQRQHESLSGEKQSLVAAIKGELDKEGLYMSLKDRLTIVGKILEGQRSWLGVLDIIDRVTAVQAKTSFTVSENDEVSLVVTNETLEDTFTMVDRLLSEVSAKTIANPMLDSIQYQMDGTVRVSLTFIPIF